MTQEQLPYKVRLMRQVQSRELFNRYPRRHSMTRLVKLTRDVTYPAPWAHGAPVYRKGEVVPVVPATNAPSYAFWIDTPELKDDPYGMGLEPGDYEELP